MKRKVFFLMFSVLLLSCGKQVQKVPDSLLQSEASTMVLPLPWSDNFNSGRLMDWTVVNDLPTPQSTWKVEQGVLVQGSDIYVQEKPYQRYSGTHIVTGDLNWDDYIFRAIIHNLDDDGVGFLFRYQNPQNFYRFFMLKDKNFGGPFFRLDKFENGQLSELSKIVPADYAATDTTSEIIIHVHKDTLRTHLNRKLIFEICDSSFTTGKIGFSCFANKGLCIDDVVVTDQPLDSLKALFPPKSIVIRRDHTSGNYPFAIRGIVFLDTNQNGQLDNHEVGIPNVPVSDGREVVVTDEQGVYSLGNREEDAQFVFVTVPANFKKNLNFYYVLHDSLGQRTFNFPLTPVETNEDLPAHFIQITDIHIIDESSRLHFQHLLNQLKKLVKKPLFILATGDLVERGSVSSQFEHYSQAVQNYSTPIYSIFGNHDLDNGLNRLNNFHQYLGPDYFSFDYVDWHFICFNCVIPSDKEYQWLENDLKHYSATRKILFFQHYPPSPEQLDLLAKYNIRAVFSGHWHSNKILRYQNIMAYNTPPFRFGGIDNSPAGFRLVTIDQDTIYTKYLFNTLQNRIQIVSPVPGGIHALENLNLILNIYDFPFDIARVAYQLIRPNNFNEIGELEQKADWTWSKLIEEPVFDGDYQLRFTIITADRQQIKRETNFTVRLKTSLELQAVEACSMFKRDPARTGYWPQILRPPLHLKWVGMTGSSIDFAAPIVVDSLVVIATHDRNDLATNYICAFEAQTGNLKWCYETRAAINHSLVAIHQQIIGQDVSGNVYALDLEQGELLWQQNLNPTETDFWLYATPLIVNDRLYAGNANILAVLNAENGTILWKKKLGSPWISSYASPSQFFDNLFIGSIWNQQNLFALDAVSGKRLWEFAFSGTHGAIMIYEQTGYIGTISGELLALDLVNGFEKWRTPIGQGWMSATPTPCDSLIIVGSGDGKMVAVHQANGEKIWNFQCAQSIVPISPYQTEPVALTGSPVVAGNIVYFGATDGFLYALNADTGQLLWKYNLGVPIVSTPAISGNALFIAAYDGNVYCFLADQYEYKLTGRF